VWKERLVWIKAREGGGRKKGKRGETWEWEGGKHGASGSLAVSPHCGKGIDQKEVWDAFLSLPTPVLVCNLPEQF
jgi:hypothetical protein